MKRIALPLLLCCLRVNGAVSLLPMLPEVVKAAPLIGHISTNAYFFAATCYNSVGLESPFSAEVGFVRLNGRGIPQTNSVLLGWTNSDPSVVGFRIYYGGQSRTYTNILDVGLTNQALVTLVHPLKGFYVTLSVTNGVLNYRPSLQSGNWIGTMIASTNLTNGNGSENFWRGSNAPAGARPIIKFSGRNWFT